jgi:hypothetical protein
VSSAAANHNAITGMWGTLAGYLIVLGLKAKGNIQALVLCAIPNIMRDEAQKVDEERDGPKWEPFIRFMTSRDRGPRSVSAVHGQASQSSFNGQNRALDGSRDRNCPSRLPASQLKGRMAGLCQNVRQNKVESFIGP